MNEVTDVTDEYLAALLEQTAADAPPWLADCAQDPDDGPQDRHRELPENLRHERRAKKREYLDALQIDNAARHLKRLPGDGVTLHCVCKGNYASWDIVPAVLRLAAPARITDLHIATLSFSNANIGELLTMLDTGTVGRVWILASCYFVVQNAEIYGPAADALRDRGQRIAGARTHAKVTLLALSDGRRFTIESSANLRSCRNIEQFSLTQDAALHGFHRRWIEDMTEQCTK